MNQNFNSVLIYYASFVVADIQIVIWLTVTLVRNFRIAGSCFTKLTMIFCKNICNASRFCSSFPPILFSCHSHPPPSPFRSIEGELTSLEGVRSISVSLERKEGVAEFYPDATSAAALSEKIFEMGFDTELKSAAAAGTSSSSASRQVLVKYSLPIQVFLKCASG